MCGSCRSASRISGLLHSGHLLASQEAQVLAILRGAAGALSDLAEEAATKTESRTKSPVAGAGGDASPNPGADSTGDKGDTHEVKSESYSQSSDEEEKEKAENEKEEASEEADKPDKETPEGEERKQREKARVIPRVDPHYLSKALALRPAAKTRHKERSSGSGLKRTPKSPSRSPPKRRHHDEG